MTVATTVEIVEMLLPFIPFLFLSLYLGARAIKNPTGESVDPGSMIMFAVAAAVSSIFVAFEIAVDYPWLATLYFILGIGIALKATVEVYR